MEKSIAGEEIVFDDAKRVALGDLYERMLANTEPWGTEAGGEEIEPGLRAMGYVVSSDLVRDFHSFMYEQGLVVGFNWGSWQEGRDFFANQDAAKYEQVDHEFVLKAITAILRNDRFCEGALVDSFKANVMQQLVARLIATATEAPTPTPNS